MAEQSEDEMAQRSQKSTPQRYSLSHRLFHPVHYKTRRMYYVHIRITDKQTITTKK
jgi:hypothetical protein